MTSDLHTALLRPVVLQILRATGFNYARPSVVDTFTDLAARYLLLLSTSAGQNAFNTHNDYVPSLNDIRTALSENGALYPQMSPAEEAQRPAVILPTGEVVDYEDLRGVEGFVEWCQGSVNREVRRIAGLATGAGGLGEATIEQIASGGEGREDYLNALKKSGKTDEVSDERYSGTILGKEHALQPVPIIGGPVNSIQEWSAQFLNSRTATPREGVGEAEVEGASPVSSMLSDAPETPEGGNSGAADTPRSQMQTG